MAHPTDQPAHQAAAAAEAAVAAAEAGDFHTAAAKFADALSVRPDAALYEQHAQCLMELEQYNAAAEAASRATSMTPDWGDAWLTLARALLNAGHLQAAYQACATCLALEPTHTEALEDMATVNQLLQQQTRQLIGLPGLVVAADPGGQTGPGCVIWEAGVQLARLFVELAAAQSASTSPPTDAGSPAGPVCRCSAHNAGTSCVTAALPAAPTADTAPVAAGPTVLQHACLAELPQLQGARLLELGSGTGIAGIAAAACGAHVTLSDLQAAMPLLRSNVAANEALVAAAGGSMAAVALDYSSSDLPITQTLREHQAQLLPEHCCPQHPQQQQRPLGHAQPAPDSSSDFTAQSGAAAANLNSTPALLPACTWDWAFGADLVFNQGQIAGVMSAIGNLLGLAGTAAQARAEARVAPAKCFLLAHKHRHPHVNEQLLHALQAAGCEVKQVRHVAELRVSVWLIRQEQCRKDAS